MINITMTGDRDLVARLERMPDSLRTILRRKIYALTLKLQARIQRKLSGDVLNVVTGALRRSIQPRVDEDAAGVRGRVFSAGDVKYARIHEYGGKTRAHIIEPRKALALSFMVGGNRVFARRVNHPGSVMPERSFMRSSLREMHDEIIAGLTEAIREAGRQ